MGRGDRFKEKTFGSGQFGSVKVTQKEWERVFGKKPKKGTKNG